VDALGSRDAPGQFSYSAIIDITSQGEVLAADSGNNRLQVFSLDGALLRTLPLTDSYVTDLDALSDGSFLVADGDANQIELHAASGELLRIVEGWPAPTGANADPEASIGFVAAGPDGRFYLAESRGARVVILNADGSLSEIWTGPEALPLENIMALELDPAGNLYVLSDSQSRVLKRGPHGELAELRIDEASRIALLADGSFYAASSNQLAHYAAGGTLISRWERFNLNYLLDLEVAPDGSVLVVNGDGSAELRAIIQRYDSDQTMLSGFGSSMLQPGQFRSHSTFAVSSGGDVWIVDTGDGLPPHMLIHLDRDGLQLSAVKKLGGEQLTCDSYLLAALPDQSVMVADPCAGAVIRMDAAGQAVARWGERGSGPSQFNMIADMALAVDEQSLYILDAGQGAVVQLGLDGTPIARWTAAELGAQTPVALAIDAEGTLFLLDEATQQIVTHPAHGEGRSWSLPDSLDEVYRIAVDAAQRRVYVGGTQSYLYVFDGEGTYLGRTRVLDGSNVMVKIGPGGRVYRSAGYQQIQLYEPVN
jgi:sugar lactone lactonase YvrE